MQQNKASQAIEKRVDELMAEANACPWWSVHRKAIILQEAQGLLLPMIHEKMKEAIEDNPVLVRMFNS